MGRRPAGSPGGATNPGPLGAGRVRPRVLFVGPTPPPHYGNAVWSGTILTSERVRAAVELRHFDTSDPRPIANMGRLDPRNVLLALRHIRQMGVAFPGWHPDLVYVPISQNALGFLRDALLIHRARSRGWPVVAHLHGGDFPRFAHRSRWPVRVMVRRTLARVTEGWVLGEGLRSQFEDLLPPQKIRVVPNGIPDWTLDHEEAPAPDPEASPTLLFLGQISRRKGVFDLLEGAMRPAREGISFRLILAGGWKRAEEEEEARPLIRRLEGQGIEVVRPGVVTGAEKWRLFSSADLFVLPSHGEGQPLTILEAMAGGLPVVATPVGAIPDAVVEGETGLLVPPGEPEALGRALGDLLTDAPRRRVLGSAGRRRYEARFTDDALARSFVEAVEGAAARASGAGDDR
jgi:glycosyltransferase involved in cell wall biosynthesis